MCPRVSPFRGAHPPTLRICGAPPHAPLPGEPSSARQRNSHPGMNGAPPHTPLPGEPSSAHRRNSDSGMNGLRPTLRCSEGMSARRVAALPMEGCGGVSPYESEGGRVGGKNRSPSAMPLRPGDGDSGAAAALCTRYRCAERSHSSVGTGTPRPPARASPPTTARRGAPRDHGGILLAGDSPVAESGFTTAAFCCAARRGPERAAYGFLMEPRGERFPSERP